MVHFLRPAKITMLAFMLLVLFMPVVYLRTEQDRTNYLPGEEQSSTTHTKVLQSPFEEYVFHTDGRPDIFLGIFQRNYFGNLAGIPLSVIYYLLAAGLTWLIQRYRLFKQSKGQMYA